MKAMFYVLVVVAVLGFAKHISTDFTSPVKHAVTERHELLNNL